MLLSILQLIDRRETASNWQLGGLGHGTCDMTFNLGCNDLMFACVTAANCRRKKVNDREEKKKEGKNK